MTWCILVPDRPTVREVGEVGPNSMRISWSLVKGAISFVVSANWTPAGTRTDQTVAETTTEPFLVMSLPETGTSYDITVSAEGRSGLSNPSDTVKENTCKYLRTHGFLMTRVRKYRVPD